MYTTVFSCALYMGFTLLFRKRRVEVKEMMILMGMRNFIK